MSNFDSPIKLWTGYITHINLEEHYDNYSHEKVVKVIFHGTEYNNKSWEYRLIFRVPKLHNIYLQNLIDYLKLNSDELGKFPLDLFEYLLVEPSNEFYTKASKYEIIIKLLITKNLNLFNKKSLKITYDYMQFCS